MTTAVSSLFEFQMGLTNPTSTVRQFLFGGNDITDRVINFPPLTKNAESPVGQSIAIVFENADGFFNTLTSSKTQMILPGEMKYGFAVAANTSDTITLFKGTLNRASYTLNRVTLTFQDNLAGLKKRRVGNSTTAVLMPSSSNPADILWSVVTSYGLLSNITSTSNPDIDYASWLEWKGVLAEESYLFSGQFQGDTVINILTDMQKITDSTITVNENNQITTTRWTTPASPAATVTHDDIIDIGMTITDNDIVNKASIGFGYNVSSESFEGFNTAVNTSSVNSYGLQQTIMDFNTSWHDLTASAGNLAQRITFRRDAPNIEISCTIPLNHVNLQVGDEVGVVTSVFSMNAVFNLVEKTVNIENYTMKLKLSEGLSKAAGVLGTFILDSEYWGKLDQDYNPIF